MWITVGARVKAKHNFGPGYPLIRVGERGTVITLDGKSAGIKWDSMTAISIWYVYYEYLEPLPLLDRLAEI